MLETAHVTVQSRMLLVLGAASYSIYLVHHLVVQSLVRMAGGGTPHPSLALAMAEGLAIFIVATLVGIAVHTWVEKPASNWLRRRIAGIPWPLQQAAKRQIAICVPISTTREVGMRKNSVALVALRLRKMNR